MKSLKLAAAILTGCALLAGMSGPSMAQEKIVLHGASAYNKDHIFNRTMEKFAELTKKYYGKPVEFVMHENGELGNEAGYFGLMTRGTSVDFAVVAPAHMTPISRSAGILDTPFLFKDVDQWKKAVSGDAFQPIIDDIEKRGHVKILGLGGGAERNILSKKPADDLAGLHGLKMRVQGTPIHAKAFAAVGIVPSVIAYNEIYNAIQSGVIDALENEASTNAQMRFYEVAPEVIRTRHIITVRPLVFNGATFDRLPPDLQAAIVKAGAEAAAWWRATESAEDAATLEKMAAEGKVRIHEFKDREAMHEKVQPVIDAYAKELGAEDVLARIRAIK
ncbi:TRAP transporter substrate-binding protein [Ancylobacter mangrovi]|uniref:TRAP transporter substrate-binding protein n=1 Tax=Ancylobacter mangrovi TaxID=2972472 RepID=UPI002163188F|nr:TRAP transporter substrate-binding protein [Ancylobacter mangrovi]MCS0503351.1 TRAP transporter substrate-binding protein [Ancylobacter mangrovi]